MRETSGKSASSSQDPPQGLFGITCGPFLPSYAFQQRSNAFRMASRTALRWRTPWSMRLPLCAFILALLSPALHAVNLADAGLHDWHMPLIGQPSHLQALSPRFHYPAGPSATSVSSLVYTVTQRNVLAAIEPKAGGIGGLQRALRSTYRGVASSASIWCLLTWTNALLPLSLAWRHIFPEDRPILKYVLYGDCE